MHSTIAKLVATTWLLGTVACAQGAITTLSTIDKTQSHVTVSKSLVDADGVDSVTLIATIKDTTGKLLPHAQVSFTASGERNVLTPTGTATDANGVLRATLSSTFAEIKTINARVSKDGAVVQLIDAPQVRFQAGVATRLVFTSQPVSGIAGNALTPTVQVAAEDVNGNVATAFSGVVTMTLSGGTTGATLGGTAQRAAASGVVNFPGLSVDVSGTGYQLNAASTGLAQATSHPFDMASPQGRLVFTSQPNDIVAGEVFAPAVTVTLEDPNGHTLANSAGNVTLTLQNNPNNATLYGTITRSLVAGVATFDDITVATVGAGYRMQASGASATDANSATFDVAPGPMSLANSVLTVTPNPTPVHAAATVSFVGRDAYNNALAGATVSFTSNAPSGTASFTPSSGTLDGAGRLDTSYVSASLGAQTLTASVGAQSASVTLNVGAGSPNQTLTSLSISPNPVTVNQNTTITLRVQDDDGNPVSAQSVTFTGDGQRDALGASSGTTDNLGQTSTTYTSQQAGAHTVTASFGSFTFTGSVTFTAANPNATASALTINPNAFTIDENATVTLSLVDDFGNNVEGQSVTFASTGTGYAFSVNPATSDANGVSTTRYSATQVGAVTLNANVAGLVFTANANVQVGNPNAAASSVVATPSSLGADGVAFTVVELTLKDRLGHAIAGAMPTWSVDGTRNQFTASGLATDANGKSRGTLSSTHAETKTITATAGTTVINGQVTFVGAPNAATSTLTLNPNTAAADGNANMAITVVVADGDGNPLANQNVTLSGTGRGDVFTPQQGTTNASGTFTATLGTNFAGNQNVTATFGNVALVQQAAFTTPVCNKTLLLPSAPYAMSGTVTVIDNLMADFTGDGFLDMAELVPPNYLEVYAGDGRGGFANPNTLPLPSPPTSFDASDVSADGILDLVIADAQGFRVYSGNGDGTFAPLTAVTQNPNAAQIKAVDVNGDHLADLISLDATHGQVGVNLRQSNSVTPLAQYASAANLSDNSNAFAIADFTGDGNADIVVANRNGGVNSNGYLAFLRGNGDGTFQPFQEVDIDSASNAPAFILAAKLDSDAFMDIVVVEFGQVEMMRGHGDGTFTASAKKSLAPIYLPAYASAGDLNNDGYTDVVVNGEFGEVLRFFGDGTGAFQNVASVENNIYPRRPFLVDLNNDGYLDLASGGYFGVTARLGRGDLTFTAPLQTSVPGVFAMSTGDLDHDGDIDVVAQTPGALLSFVNDGNGALSQGSLQTTGVYSWVALADFNNDQNLDYAAYTASTLITALGDGHGGFLPELDTTAPAALTAIRIGDVNGDGQSDVVATSNASIYVFIGDGHGAFQAPASYAFLNAQSLAVGDTTGDGRAEVAVADFTTLQLYVNQGDAQATLVPNGTTYTLWTSATPSQISIADVNKDGKGDVVCAVLNAAQVFYGQGKSDGTLTTSTLAAVTPYSVRVGDMNGDGLNDIVAGGFGAQLLTQKVDGTFNPYVMYDIGAVTTPGRLADMNGDGRLDYVAADILQGYTLSNTGGGIIVGLSSGCR